jgi:hypothetical protein
MKKHEFLLPFARLLTRGEGDVYDALPFQSSDSFGDEHAPALAAPATWNNEAVAVMAEAACASVPADLRAVEENTVPSWLWRHQPRGTRRAQETDMRDILNRAVGSAAAKAWKLGLFSSEKHARSFYDETRFALIQRCIALTPDVLAAWGLSWAYGITEPAPAQHRAAKMPALTNEAMDAVVGKTKDATANTLWKKLFAMRGADVATVTLRLSDITRDWHSAASNPARAAIDMMALRHNDGSVNITAVRHTARLLAVLLDLQDRGDVTIGLANIAPLLMALGLSYDSDAARALVASLAALVTAECYAASAEMAALRGESHNFADNRESIMRSLRNHRRATYGDSNDYEKLSVLPAPLPLKNCPDLALAAEAQRRWDDTLDMARTFGLRAIQVTDLTPSPLLSVLMSSASQGLESMQSLTALAHDDADHFHMVLHPAVGEALTRLEYPGNTASATKQHIVGAQALRKAPAINHATLRACGLTDSVLEKIEAYLPLVNTIRLAVTPWVVGVEFCRTQLKIPARTLESPRFDLLRHLGFSDAECDTANRFCYGFGTLRNAKILHLRHRPIFACGMEISAEARLRMAASVQSFVSGDTGMTATIPASQSVTRGAELTLAAWRRGLKSLTFVFDSTIAVKEPVVKSLHATAPRRIKAATHAHAKPFAPPPHSSRAAKHAAVHAVKKAAGGKRAAHKA